MNLRKDFINGLFDLLEARAIPYCVLRNYDNIFTDATSDVDLVVAPEKLLAFKECLRNAASATGQRFVHRARYINYSYVFWNPESDFVRIDFETEVRWRCFPILSAASILEHKRRRENFFIPHARHESVVLFLQAVWRGNLTDRYRAQLARLYGECGDREELRKTYREAFGAAGGGLVEFHSQIAKQEFSPALCSRLKRSIRAKVFKQPAALGDFLSFARDDALRLWERLRKPAGISLLFASVGNRDQEFDRLMHRLEFLFPVNKCLFQNIDLSGAKAASGWEIGTKLRRLRILFKGGLFVRHYRVDGDADLNRLARMHPRLLFPSRAFVCLEDSRQRLCVAHVGTGFMAESNGAASAQTDFSSLLIGFFASVLEKERNVGQSQPTRCGTFAVLIGLDGSGKTTLARNLAQLAATKSNFEGVRYFHWLPRLLKSIEFPFAETGNTTRKAALRRSGSNSVLSTLRLAKNLVFTRIAFTFRMRPRLRRGFLVLSDRYFYNYLLDPASLKFSGPDWLLKLALPLFPKPDVVLTLDAPAETLLARKQELSREQIAAQSAVKDRLDFQGIQRIPVDATQPAERIAETALTGLIAAAGKRKT